MSTEILENFNQILTFSTSCFYQGDIVNISDQSFDIYSEEMNIFICNRNDFKSNGFRFVKGSSLKSCIKDKYYLIQFVEKFVNNLQFERSDYYHGFAMQISTEKFALKCTEQGYWMCNKEEFKANKILFAKGSEFFEVQEIDINSGYFIRFSDEEFKALNNNENNGKRRCSRCHQDLNIDKFADRFNVCRICKSDRQRKKGLNDFYSLAQDDEQIILDAQKFVCPICGEAETRINPRSKKLNHLCMDEDHNDDNRLRQMLCHNCNLIIGNCDDNIEILKNAIKYLEFHTQFKGKGKKAIVNFFKQQSNNSNLINSKKSIKGE